MSWFVADDAVQRGAQPAAAALLRYDPWPHLPWRIVAHVLIVTALQFGDPVASLVLMESGDAACHVGAHSGVFEDHRPASTSG